MEKDKIDCLIWPELNDYTGKSKTVACFTSENDVDTAKFVTKTCTFWNDLTNWILISNKNPTDFSQSLKFWFTIEKKFLTEKEIEELVKKENEKYFIKNYVIEQDDLEAFSWKKFREYAKNELIKREKLNGINLSEYDHVLSCAFYGPICDNFRQDETNTVSIIKILPSKQMINSLFDQANKFINSPIVSNKFHSSQIKAASKILEHYLNIPKIVEIK